MYLIKYCLFISISGVSMMFQQNEYDLKFERYEVKEYDKKIVTFAKSHNFKYNRTNAVVNITIHFAENLGNRTNVEVQAYKFASNEYRLFPLRFMFNLCNACAKNDFGLRDFYKCGNFTRCPMKKGHFLICKWALDGHRFPPHIPNGIYKLDLKYFVGNQMALFGEAYGSITRPIPIF